MAHFRFRWLVLAVAVMAVVGVLLMQSHGRSDSDRSAAERYGFPPGIRSDNSGFRVAFPLVY